MHTEGRTQKFLVLNMVVHEVTVELKSALHATIHRRLGQVYNRVLFSLRMNSLVVESAHLTLFFL